MPSRSLGWRCAANGRLRAGGNVRRNTHGQKAEELNTTGVYSIVRHPLYVGNYLIGLGVTLVWLNWWVPVVYTLCFWVYYERIMVAEERFLEQKFGDSFRQWAASTPAFVPRSLDGGARHYPFQCGPCSAESIRASCC